MEARVMNKAGMAAAAGMGAFVLAGAGLGTSTALAADAAASVAETAQQPAVAQVSAAPTAGMQQLDVVEGTFAFSQGNVTPTAQVRRAFADAARYLCASEYMPADEFGDALAWQLSVTSDTGTQMSATLGELAEDGAATITMGCSCSGNPAGGLASANVEVSGVTLASLMEQAGVTKAANTVTFTCADGYEVSLPLAYVTQRHALVAFSANGAPLSDSVGGTNQLWVGSTSARHFARDVVAVTFEARDAADIPAAPGTAGASEGVNLPNAGISSVA